MTPKEAKSILNEYRNRNYNSTFRDELELANAIDKVLTKYVELEERNTPASPIMGANRKGRLELVCPSCNFDIVLKEKFCSHCGQKLDWER